MRILAILTAILLSSCGPEKTLSPEEALFVHPLIIGASISADTGSVSPGKRLGSRYSRFLDVKTIARGGAPGRDIIPLVSDSVIRDRTIIVGVDLLFWDTTLQGSSETTITALKSLIQRAFARDMPLIIGNVPNLMVGAQNSRDEINKALSEECKIERRCLILALDDLHQQILRDGYLEIKGERYEMHEILPDGLHLSLPASEEIADRMLRAVKTILR